jgi:hypothetical protein
MKKPPFTAKQREILKGVRQLHHTMLELMIRQSETRSAMFAGAIIRALIRKGFLTEEEVAAAKAELAAAMAVEDALSPEIEAARNELHRSSLGR